MDKIAKYLGIDIGGTAVKMGIVTKNGEILSKSQFPVAFDGYETPILVTVLKSTDLFLSENNIDPEALGGIAVSATGQIDSNLGIVAGSGGNIKNWVGARIKEEFEAKYRKKTVVINDANCVALGEAWIGNARGKKNALIFTIGTGLGGGIMVDDRILLGESGFAGELGHFSIHYEGRPCTCGNRGCFEQYASMTALVKQVKSYVEEENIIVDGEINGMYIFEEVKRGNEGIARIVDAWIDDISHGITSLVHVFNPEVVLIGGGVSLQKELFIDKLEQKLQSRIMPNFRKKLQLLPAKLGNDAGMVGAVYHFLKNEENTLIP